MKIGDFVIIIGGYEDCHDSWEMLVVADQKLVDLHSAHTCGASVSYDAEETWLRKMTNFTLPAVVDLTYQIWLE